MKSIRVECCGIRFAFLLCVAMKRNLTLSLGSGIKDDGNMRIELEYTNIHIKDINKEILITVTKVGRKAGSYSGSQKSVPPFIAPNIPCSQEPAAGYCPEPNGSTSYPHSLCL